MGTAPLLEGLLDAAAKTPDRDALVIGVESVSYAKLRARTASAAAFLRKEGVKPGERVVFSALGRPAAVYAYAACHQLGAVAVPVDPNISERGLRGILESTGPRVAFIDEEVERLDCALPGLKSAAAVRPEDTADILFTGGSTGIPKGVMQTHGNLLAFARGRNAAVAAASDDRLLLPLPLSHGFGLGRLRASLLQGSTVILADGFLAPESLARHVAQGANALCCVPAGFELLFQALGDKVGDWRGRLRYIETATAPLPEETKRRLLRLLPGTRLFNSYGLTEATSSVAFADVSAAADRPGTVGKPIPGVEVKVEAGRLYLKGPSVMKGYWKDAERTAEVLRDGWLATNDFVTRDADGYLYITGRVEELINVGGRKVAPAEVEHALKEHPAVLDCACAAVPDPKGVTGEAVKAWVVLRPGAAADDAELTAFLRSRLEGWKLPAAFARVDALPRSPVGKLRRSELKDAPKGEPIAVIGMAGRFPGADGVEAFWKNLVEGVDCVREVPASRWEAGRFGTPPRGAFLDDVTGFDAGFFGISPREAERMDPQQRLSLEVAWEALEDAGVPLEKVAGTDAGVFMGVTHFDHALLALKDPAGVSGYELAGNLLYSMSGRISYFLGAHGPSLAVDTACSSSLVAVHLACRSLRDGESSLALAGGVNLVLHPAFSLAFSKAGAMSGDGRSKPFDKTADGFVRGEGAGIVVLKRLSDAVRDGDRVHAVIRGTAVRHGGHGPGYTVPNPDAQAELFRRALADAGVDAADVGLVEAHATGTAIGDPAEFRAMAEVYGTRSGEPCAIGSAKSTIGHLESAAGIAGLIKAILSLKHGAVPPIPTLKETDPKLGLEATRFALPKSLLPWPEGEKKRLAAVSAFGISGTIAHAIVEESTTSPSPRLRGEEPAGRMAGGEGEPYLLPLSARSPEALSGYPALWAGWLAEGETGRATLRDLCFTASRHRTHHDFRHAIAFTSLEDLRSQLSSAVPSTSKASKLAFIFCGQGAQWPAMGRTLLTAEPVFRSFIEDCDRILEPIAGWSIVEELKAGPRKSRLHKTEILQPVLFAVQGGLAALWKSRGVEPAAVAGHSAGEIAAAYVSGAITLEEGVVIAWHRGRLMKRAASKGKMAAVGLTREQAAASIKPYKGKLWIAAENGPQTTVVSGANAAIKDLVKRLAKDGTFTRIVNEDYAFHSHQMEPFVPELKRSLAKLRPRKAAIPMVSTVTGTVLSGTELTAAYWGRNLRERVRFTDASAALHAGGFDTFVEVGPNPVFGLGVPSMKKGEDERLTMLRSLGALWSAGVPVRWDAVYPSGTIAALPSYPWQRERYWLDGADANDWGSDASKPTAKLYTQEWLPSPLPTGEAPAGRVAGGEGASTWLILSDGRIGPALEKELKRSGDSCLLITASSEYRTPAAFERLFASLEATPLRGIVDLWGSDTLGVLHLTQALLKKPFDSAQGKPRLWLVTERAQAVNGETVDVEQAPAWGLGRVIAEEHPELRCTLVDIGGPADAAALAEQLRRDGSGEPFALRGGRRLSPKLKALPAPANGKPHSFRADATYLITGGLGALGVTLAKWLVAHGARSLALAGRHKPSPKVERELEALRKTGARIQTLLVDVGDEKALSKALAKAEKPAPLKGVFHLAGTLDDGLLEGVSDKRMASVLNPKTVGALNLERALAKRKLDCFVLFSSIGSVVGEPGRGSYAAANAALDALSFRRRAAGLKSLSIGWSGWSGAGMAAELQRRGKMGTGDGGKELLDPDVALETLGRLLHSDVPPHVLATAYDIKPLSPFTGRGGREAAGEGIPYFKSLLSKVLRIPVAKLPVDKPLADLGLDSILAVEASAQASRDLGRRIPPAAFLGATTVSSLAS